jgi:protein phosphatase
MRPDGDTQELSDSRLKDPNSAEVTVEVAGATHRGQVKNTNDDHYVSLRFQRAMDTLCTNLDETDLERNSEEIAYGLLVADGKGFMASGEAASRLALRKLVEIVVNTPDWIMRWNQREDEATVVRRITQRFREVDEVLRHEAEQNGSVVGKGTTMTIAVSLGATLLIGHVGDSRAYLMRGQTLHQLTTDHTLAQALVDAGIVNPGDAAMKAVQHVLTAVLGASDRADPQVMRFLLSHNDQVLLCTDGLTKMVPAKTIAAVLWENHSPQAACDSLIDLALSAGGLDNVTVVLARYRFPVAS